MRAAKRDTYTGLSRQLIHVRCVSTLNTLHVPFHKQAIYINCDFSCTGETQPQRTMLFYHSPPGWMDIYIYIHIPKACPAQISQMHHEDYTRLRAI